MLNKRGAITGDILGTFIFGGISIGIMLIAVFIIAPAMGERAKASVTESIAQFNDNIFLFNYLRYSIGERTMADLVIQSHMSGNYESLETETRNFLTELYQAENIRWRIYINDEEVIDNMPLFGRERTVHETYIPNYYGLEPIKFKFVFY